MRRRAILALTAVALALAAVMWERQSGASRRALSQATTWHYQLQKLDVDRLAASTADLLVIDHSRDGTGNGALTAAEVARLQLKPNGGRRPVIAYLSIGEAEEYRFYWRPEWKAEAPPWLFAENCRWPGNHLVRYWMEPWKDIIFRGDASYLTRILDAGFDGVYLDRIDAYWDLRERYPDGRREMIAFVLELAAAARARKPGFLVIAQNAEALLDDARYRDAIDAIAKEDLLHGVAATGQRNDASLIAWSTGQLKLLAADGKPIFAVEYLRAREAVESTHRELAALGLRATFPTRALDGRDPLEPDPSAVPAAVGTPEFSVKHCS